MPRNGRGQLTQIAKLLGIHTTMVTHILRGQSHLSVEQGLALADFLGLSSLETEYFVTHIQAERATNAESRSYFARQLSQIKDRALNLTERLPVKKILDERDQAIFYSAWYFSAVRLMSAIDGFHSREAIADHLALPLSLVNRVVDFLVEVGLCHESKGLLTCSDSTTYVGRDSLFVGRHHSNWRLRALEQINDIAHEELVFTHPITISKSDFGKIREELVAVIETFRKISDPSPPEQLCCLNIDWIKIRV